MASIVNKTVWITGASSGIGEALAYELNKRGCKLIISSRRTNELERVKNCCQHQELVKIIALDLENFEEIPKQTLEALGAYGAIDILINNAGISQRSYIAETDFDVYRKLMNVNYLGTIAITKSLLPHFIDRKTGHFVTVTSLMGKFGSPLRSGYCASKHALHGFFDVLRMEHEQDGIAVTLICPGFVQTNIAHNALTAKGKPQNQNDTATQNGISVTSCALQIIRAIERKKFESYIGGKETFGVYLKRAFPKLLHKVVLKSKVR